MLQRLLGPHLRKLLKNYPAVALIGPRQSGKTTLARTLSPLYFDMEQAEDQLRADVEWDHLLQQTKPVIFDEAQTWPELFNRLRGAIDKNRKRNGRFLLLGSVAPALMRHVSESLAGRLGLCELSPLNIQEIAPTKMDPLWLMGGYPDGGILKKNSFPNWQKNYLSLLAGRDLPQWGLSAAPYVTEKLFKMLAVLHGNPLNASQIGQSLGISYHTVDSYIGYLVQAFLIRLLPPYTSNLRKRIIKSPKMYWRDSGLLHALQGAGHFSQLLQQPWVGMSWEGWVIEQILSFLTLQGKSFDAFYLRTKTQDEIDLILEYAGKIWAIEIKLTSNPSPQMIQQLKKTGSLIRADQMILISRSKQTIKGDHLLATNLSGFMSQL